MTLPIPEELLSRAISAFGPRSQWRMLQEECGELVAAVNHTMRNREPRALIEEVADVLIMAMQARHMLGAGMVDAAIARKLARLEQRIAEAKR